jgi:myo-inositol-1(or 4)-monophosphatase
LNTEFNKELLQTAREAALRAGEIHLKYFGKDKEISHKLNEFDLVTNADKEAEDAIVNIIQQKYRDHGFLAEEAHKETESMPYTWIIDPLDGTTNYAHNFPQFCVSIGLRYKNELILGVVFDAVKKEFFHAVKGMGAYLNENPIHVSNIKTVNKSLLATGFPYDRVTNTATNLDYFEVFTYESQAIRRPGAAALDMCYVACGRFDGFWELKLSPWDTAAGAVIVREAGGIVTNFFTDDFDIYQKHIIASNPHIYQEMSDILEKTNPIPPVF